MEQWEGGRLTDLEDTAGLLVNEARDTLDTTTTGETANSGLGNTPDTHSSVSCQSDVRGGVSHWMLSRSTFLCLLAPPLPRPLPPFPRPDIVDKKFELRLG